MFQFNFEWDVAKAIGNRHKHGVSFDLAATVFHDPLMMSIADKDHSEGEERWLTLGQAENGALLVVVHTYHETDVCSSSIRIISARSATKRERRQYEAM
ncbi:MAG: BrnT family toxin [Halomonas sp.]|uniref:BrnT family toxin n=1 Tax=Halomonas sp. TaxID=1486246 RepID=UPI002ACD5EBA|nr:BrnT family toxin [Halomonas sp.]MDZ7851994.1 BrnT family toxin [Halomonas sp.]